MLLRGLYEVVGFREPEPGYWIIAIWTLALRAPRYVLNL
jgi:hypothetical protein